MAMSKTAPITNYFKRLNQSFQRKRPFPEEGSENSRGIIRRKSSLSSHEDDRNPQIETHTPQSSSQPSIQSPPDEDADPSSQPLPSGYRTTPSQAVYSSRSLENGITERYRRQSQGQHLVWTPTNEGQTPMPELGQSCPATAAADTLVHSGQHHRTPVYATNESISRYTTIISSQPTLTSSQRIVRNGETIVRNSDDESDASLEDIDERLNNGRLSKESSPERDSQLPSPDDEGNQRMRRATRGAARARNPPSRASSTLPATAKTYKFSLESLAKQKRQDETSECDIAKAKSMLESYDRRKASTGGTKGVLDTSIIDSIMKEHGDEDDIGRLKSAIQRTEALQHAKSWSFFGNKSDTPLDKESKFPEVQDERLGRLFDGILSRQQTFLSGYAGEYAMKQGLPEEVLLWIMDAVCMESRDDLRYSYTLTLKQATVHLTPLLTPNLIDRLFQTLGATAAALDFEVPVVPHATVSQSVEYTARPGLLSLLALLGSVAGDLVAQSRNHLLRTLCRLAVDRSVIKSSHAASVIGETMASLIESIPQNELVHEIEMVMTSVYDTVSDSSLRLQLLQVIPAWYSRLTLFRQRLALAFFFQDSQYLSKVAEHIVDLKLISRRLEKPQFAVTNETDFDELTASISILSISIDCGDLPSTCNKEAELAFNKDVDALVLKVNSMFNDIVDTGASHMRRTEAKEVLEGFQRRLEYAVRTKPKPKKMIFGNAKFVPLHEELNMQGNMADYLGSRKSNDLLTMANDS